MTRYTLRALGLTALLLGVSAPSGNVASAATIRIEVKGLILAPAEVAAHVGDTIEWMNGDLPPHTSGRTVIRSAGKVEYYCRYHPNMKAVITVEPE